MGAGKRVGVLGSMVWDRIDHPGGEPVERWGGISYSLAAAAAAAPTGWILRPIMKVGRDLAKEARTFMAGVPALELPGGVQEVDAPNNRVHLRYRDLHHRDEQLSGGVPRWEWEELEPLLSGLDALYVNLISGFELDLETATRLRGVVGGPIYADLHSLMLGMDVNGRRVPASLACADEWLAAFDVVQVNETELPLLVGSEDPWAGATRAVRHAVPALLVTRGPAGAVAIAAGFGPQPWARAGHDVGRLDVPTRRVIAEGDPTGCGDVWGATCFMALVRGESLAGAVQAANDAAARNAEYRGAEGLYSFLMEVA